jgi:hypothetical protein
MNDSAAFERELEQELHRFLDPIAVAPIPPRKTPGSSGMSRTLLGGAGAALGLKLFTGVAAVAFAAVAAGAATEVVVTRSLNPADWSQQVHQTIQSNQHGQQTDTVKPAPMTNDAPGKGPIKANATPSGNGGSNTGGSTGGANPKKPLGSPPTGGTDHPGPPPVPAN